MEEDKDSNNQLKEISNEEIEKAKQLANKVDNLNLNPRRDGNIEMGIEPMTIKEEIGADETCKNQTYNPSNYPENQSPTHSDDQTPEYQPSQIPPLEITPLSKDTVDNQLDPIDPVGLQIKKERIESDQDPDLQTASFYGTEGDIDERIERAKANKAEAKRIAEEKTKLILMQKNKWKQIRKKYINSLNSLK